MSAYASGGLAAQRLSEPTTASGPSTTYSYGTSPREPARKGAESEVVCAFEARHDSVRRVRNLVTETLLDWQLSTLSEDVELVVSELVTNALAASGGASLPSHEPLTAEGTHDPGDAGSCELIEVRMRRSGTMLTCTVTDTNDEGLPECDPAAGGVNGLGEILQNGRGLWLVGAFSHSWGWAHRSEGGKMVWAHFLVNDTNYGC